MKLLKSLTSMTFIALLASCQSDIAVEKAELGGTVVNAKAKLQPVGSTTKSFGAIHSSLTSTLSIQVRNNGGLTAEDITATITGAAFRFTGGSNSFPGTNGTCDASSGIAEDATCTMELIFTPGSVANFSETLTLEYTSEGDSGTTDYSITLTGVGANVSVPAFSVADGADFGDLATSGGTGATVERLITVSNAGVLNINNISFTGLSGSFSIVNDSATTCDLTGTGSIQGSFASTTNSCVVKVRYAPTSVESLSQNFTINYNDTVNTTSGSQAITGEGVTAGNLVINGGADYSFGSVAQNSTANADITIQNTGTHAISTYDLASLSLPFSYQGGGAFPGTGGTCDKSAGLAGGASCIIKAAFSPTNTGAQSEVLDFTYSNGITTNVRSSQNITGTATGPGEIAAKTAGDFNFGTRVIGQSYDIDLVLINNGQTNVTAMNLNTLSGNTSQINWKGGSFPGGSGGSYCATSNGTLASGGGECTVTITYTPDGAGPFSANMTFDYNNGASTLTNQDIGTTLEGSAATAAVINVTSPSGGAALDFTQGDDSPIGQTVTQTFTIKNTGGSQGTIKTSAFTTGTDYSYPGGSFPGTNGTCDSGGVLAGGSSCTVEVAFNASTRGTKTDSITLTYDDGAGGGSANQTVSPSPNFTGDSGELATISDDEADDSHNFGEYGLNTIKTDNILTLTITNDSQDLPVTSLASSFSGADSSMFSVDTAASTCDDGGGTLSASQSCTFVIKFVPTTSGIKSATFSVTSHNGLNANSQLDIALSGTGKAIPVLTITSDATGDPATTDFGKVATGSDKGDHVAGTSNYNVVTYTIANNTADSVPATGITAAAFDFPSHFRFSETGSFPGNPTGTDDCANSGQSLAVGESCTIEVEFKPTANGTYSDSLKIRYNNENSATTELNKNITGIASAAVALTLDPKAGSSASFGTFAPSSNIAATDRQQVFTITNGSSDLDARNFAIALSDTSQFSLQAGAAAHTCDDLADTTILPAGASCDIVVEYNPNATGNHSSNLEVTFNDGTGTTGTTADSIEALSGVAVNPASLVINTDGSGTGANISFGTVAAESVTLVQVKVTNSGGLAAKTVGDTNSLNGTKFRYFSDGSYPYGSVGTFPGTGGDGCGTEIAAGVTCTLYVEYVPDANATADDTFTLTYDDGSNSSQTSAQQFQGTAVNPASLTINVDTASAFGTRAQNTNIPVDYTFTINNGGGVSATDVSAALTDNAGESNFSITNQNPASCASTGTIAAGANCVLTVRFKPDAAAVVGVKAEDLDITYVDGQHQSATDGSATDKGGTDSNASTEYVGQALTGTAQTKATLAVHSGSAASSPHAFGNVALDSVNEITITIENTGGVHATAVASAAVNPIRYKADGALANNSGTFPGGGTCTGTIAAGASCTMVIEYASTSTHTLSSTENLNITYNNENDGDSPGATDAMTFSFTGSSIGQAVLEIDMSPNSADFGDKAQGTTLPQTYTYTLKHVAGSSTVAATNIGLSLSNTTDYTLTDSNTCIGSSLNFGSTCDFTVSFAPTLDQDAITSVLSLTYNDGQASDGTDNTSNLDSDGSGATEQLNITLTGNGKSPAVLSMTDCESSASPYDFGDNAIGSTDNDGSGSKDGTAPTELTNSNGNYCTFTLTNSGEVAASSITVKSITNTDFKIEGGSWPGSPTSGTPCTDSLATGASCKFVMKYEPTGSEETDNGTITLSYGNDTGNTVDTAAFALAGTAKNPADLDVSVAGGTAFGHVFANMQTGASPTWAKANKVITVTNNGNVPAKLLANPTISNATFAIDSGNTTCSTSSSIGVGASCVIEVSFRPTAVVDTTGTVTINYDNFSDTQESPLPSSTFSGNSDWDKRKEVNIDMSAHISADLTNFPLAIRLPDAAMPDTEMDQVDVTFVDTDGTQLKHEFEVFNVTGESIAWVKIPTLSSSNSQKIYMYYDNASSSASQEDADNVWTNYTNVYHLTNVTDSSSNGRTLAPQGAAGAEHAAGILGNSITLSASATNDINNESYRYTGDSGYQNSFTAFSTSMWFKPNGGSDVYQGLSLCINPIGDAGNTDRTLMNISYSNGQTTTNPLVATEDLFVGVGTDGDPATATATSGTGAGAGTVTEDSWVNIAVTWSDGGNLKIYQDGAEVASVAGAGGTITGCDMLVIGQGAENAELVGGDLTQNNYVGEIDEFKMTNLERTADWIKAQYEAERSGSAVITGIGSEEDF